MNKVHFKRHGSAGWLELQELSVVPNDYLDGSYYIEYQQGSNALKITVCFSVEKEWNKKKFIEDGHVKVLLNKTFSEFDYEQIEKAINEILDAPINLEHFIESYHIPRHEGENDSDRDLINGVDVTGMSTREVIAATGISLIKYFKDWKLNQDEILENPTERILNMKFQDFFRVIHWDHNCHGANKERFNEVFNR